MPVLLTPVLSSVFTRHKGLRRYPFTPETSGVEQELADTLSLCSVAEWHQQVQFETQFTDFFLDMGCRVNQSHAIGIECDGLAYHSDRLRDFCRDALMLGTGRLACIYRIEAWAVRKRRVDWLRVLSVLEPGLFTPDRVTDVFGLGEAYDNIIGGPIQTRHLGFMRRTTARSSAVRAFIGFAARHRGVSFPVLVERFRRAGVPVG